MRFNARADSLASAALSPTATIPQWPQDLIREHKALLFASEDSSPAVMTTLRFATLQSGAPSSDIQHLRLPRTQQRLLMQLRVGACRALGGWRHNSADRCPLCGTKIGRLSERASHPPAVEHIFDCPARPTPLTLESLWRDPVAALAFVAAFLPATPPPSAPQLALPPPVAMP
ncbi:hypothetical protein NESM_000877200 [Novymonas esmeraldas]|uniref:C2H2-type domain-containing protein n=1 Tax=Novymonas esmeraldas TaxID=1808958 RepID=A0AAW0F1X1_9TRYP